MLTAGLSGNDVTHAKMEEMKIISRLKLSKAGVHRPQILPALVKHFAEVQSKSVKNTRLQKVNQTLTTMNVQKLIETSTAFYTLPSEGDIAAERLLIQQAVKGELSNLSLHAANLVEALVVQNLWPSEALAILRHGMIWIQSCHRSIGDKHAQELIYRRWYGLIGRKESVEETLTPAVSLTLEGLRTQTVQPVRIDDEGKSWPLVTELISLPLTRRVKLLFKVLDMEVVEEAPSEESVQYPEWWSRCWLRYWVKNCGKRISCTELTAVITMVIVLQTQGWDAVGAAGM